MGHHVSSLDQSFVQVQLSRSQMKNFLVKLWKDEEGAEFVEWALVIGLVVVVAIAAYQFMGGTVSTVVNNVANSLSTAT